MKHVKLYEEFINEGLKAGRDEPIAKAIIAYFYAVEGGDHADELRSMGLNPERFDSNPKEQEYLSGWGKDAVRALSGARRIPSKFMTGTAIALAADNGNSYYFDGGDFVEGDKTIISNAMKLTWTQFIDELISMNIIEAPTYG
jgi:hypothetical protein